MNENESLNLIKTNFPNIEIINYEFIDTGRDNSVIIINKEIVFRIPRKIKTVEELGKEKNMIDIIVSYIPEIHIPIQTVIDGKYPFVSMPCLSGKIFSKDIFSDLNEEQKDNIAKDIANIFHKLHSIPQKKFEEIGYSGGGTDTGWIASQQEIFKTLCGNVLAKEILQNILDYIEDLGNYNYSKKVMTHGDIGGGNIFLNQDANNISGIIDFSDARVTDPATEFDCLRDFGKDFFEKVIYYYGGDKELIKRSNFYRKRREMWILMHIVEKQLDGLNDQIKKVQNVFENYKRFYS